MSEAVMSQAQIEAFAQGLYQLAAADGADEREIDVIREFLTEVDHADYIDALGDGEVDLGLLPWTLNTAYHRKLFIRACFVLVQADGVISTEERTMLNAFGASLGLSAEMDDLEAEMAGVSL